MNHRAVLALGLGLSLSALAQANAPVCEVAALIGEARSAGVLLQSGSGLKVGDEVQTGAKSRVRLRCIDGSSLVLSENSQLRIESFDADGAARKDARFFLRLGLVGQKVSAGGAWTLRTPSAVTAVRGTEFVVEVPAEDKTAVLMQSGSVDVQPAKPQTRSITAALPLIALAGLMGTDCVAGKGCSAAKPWSEARVKATLDRLSGV